MRVEISNKVKHILKSTLNVESNISLNPEVKLKEDLGLDSMSSLTFLIALEEAISGFRVDPDSLQMEDLATLDSITEYVMKTTQGTRGVGACLIGG
jgi:acyl carrier protein